MRTIPHMAKQDDYIKTALRIPRNLHARLMAESESKGSSLNAEFIARLEASFDQNSNEIEINEMFSKLERNFHSREQERSENARTLHALVRQIADRYQELLATLSPGEALSKDQIRRINLDMNDALMLQRILSESSKLVSIDDDDDPPSDDDDFQQDEPSLTRIRNKP